MAEAIGTDIGGVLAGHIGENLGGGGVPEVEGAFEAFGRLHRQRFPQAAFVISMCGEKLEVASRRWLDQHDFLDRTGLSQENLIYCREHNEKAGIARELGITHFVDDRLEVLSHFTTGQLYLFRPREAEMSSYTEHMSKVTVVNSWNEIAEDLLS